jgi:hypothetical protein
MQTVNCPYVAAAPFVPFLPISNFYFRFSNSLTLLPNACVTRLGALISALISPRTP